MPKNTALNQALCQLGLTPTEAEVYVATLAATESGAASSYRIARDAGRDPANLAKVLSGLVRRGAVRVVQDKPRLYEPVPPEEFTAGLVDRLRRHRERALAALGDLREPCVTSPLLLPDLSAVVERTTAVIAGAGTRILLFGAPALVTDLRPLLAQAAGRGCRVDVICATPVAGVRGGFTLVPEAAAPPDAWLQVVADGKTWLLASAPRGSDEPVGCWGCQPGVAAALATALDTLRKAGVFRAEMAAAAGKTDIDRRRERPRS